MDLDIPLDISSDDPNFKEKVKEIRPLLLEANIKILEKRVLTLEKSVEKLATIVKSLMRKP